MATEKDKVTAENTTTQAGRTDADQTEGTTQDKTSGNTTTQAGREES